MDKFNHFISMLSIPCDRLFLTLYRPCCIKEEIEDRSISNLCPKIHGVIFCVHRNIYTSCFVLNILFLMPCFCCCYLSVLIPFTSFFSVYLVFVDLYFLFANFFVFLIYFVANLNNLNYFHNMGRTENSLEEGILLLGKYLRNSWCVLFLHFICLIVANCFWFAFFYLVPPVVSVLFSFEIEGLEFLVNLQKKIINIIIQIRPVVVSIAITSGIVFFLLFLEVVLIFVITFFFDLKLVKNRNLVNNVEEINDINNESFNLQKRHEVNRLLTRNKRVQQPRKKENYIFNKNFNPSFNAIEILNEIEKLKKSKRKKLKQKGYNINKQKKIANSKRSPIIERIESLIILSDAEESKKIEHLNQAKSLIQEIKKKKDFKKKDLEVAKSEALILGNIANYYQENSELKQSIEFLKEEKSILEKVEQDDSVLKRKKENVIKTILVLKKNESYLDAIDFLENNKQIITKEKIEKMKWSNFAGQIYLENMGGVESLEEALKLFENALEQESNNKTEEEHFILTNIYINLGISYSRKGYFNESCNYFEKAKENLKNLGDLRNKIGKINEAKIERMMGIGCVNVRNIEKGEACFKSSKQILEEYYQQNPNDPTSQIQIALTDKCFGDLYRIYYIQQNSFNFLKESEKYYEKSLETLDKFSDTDYETSELYVSLGILYKKRSVLIDNAISFFKSAEKMLSSDHYLMVQIKSELSECYLKKKKKKKSLDYSKKSVELGKKWGNNFVPGLVHAKILLFVEKEDESAEFISKLVKIKPKNQQEKNQLEEVQQLKKRITSKHRKEKIEKLENLLRNTKIKDYEFKKRIGGKSSKKSEHKENYFSRKGDNCLGFLCTIQEEEVFIKMVWDDEGYYQTLEKSDLKQTRIEEIKKKENVVGLKPDYNNRILHCFDDKFDPTKEIFEEMKEKETSTHCVFFVQIRHEIDFYDYIKKNKNILEVDCLIYILDLLNAVKELQEHRYCHMDIKLANIMLSKYYKTLLLIDHECHNYFEENDKEWKNGEIIGTAKNFPKEAIQEITFKYVNIYQTGIVLYCLLKNDPESFPFSTENQLKMEMSHYIEIEGIRSDTQELVKGMLNTDYTKRIDVCEAIRKTEEIIAILESEYFEKSNFNQK